MIAALSAPEPWSRNEVFAVFPRLRERRHNFGRSLSGGEQQMLVLARALIRRPRLLLLDEPFEGLAGSIVEDLIDICRRLAEQGQTILIVEQNVRAALSLATRTYILNNGRILFEGAPGALLASPDIMNRHLGV